MAQRFEPAEGLHPASTEEGRSFLQERLALLGLVAFALSTFFLVSGNVLAMLSHSGGPRFYLPTQAYERWHLTGGAVSLTTWLAMRSKWRPGWPEMVAVDIASTVGALSSYAMMFAAIPRALQDGDAQLFFYRADQQMLQISSFVLLTRAIVVPSTARHTALVSIAGMLPAYVLSYWVVSAYPIGTPRIPAAAAVANTCLWSIGTIAIAVVASRVIYALRTKVVAARKLGQYVLGEKIGEGGMGTVYRASHMLLRRPAALKLIRSELAGTETLARFEREVQLTSRLSHPNTVMVFDYGRTPAGVFYYAMEFLEGIDLERLVETDGPQPPARVVHLLAQVCGSLTEAHGIGLVHRDVKPSNIIVCERGGLLDVAKVVDFGLATEIDVAGAPHITTAKSLVGSPLYIAPEAIRDPRAVDARSDLYAVGAVAYYLLTGAPVFEGTVVEVCASHLYEAPAPLTSRAVSPIPIDLERLVLSCLTKDPAQRPQSARALRDALLACDVPVWTERDARAWWNDHDLGRLSHAFVEASLAPTIPAGNDLAIARA